MKQEIRERIEKIRKGEIPEGYRKTKVGIIPNEWSVGKLGDLGDFKKGKGISGNDIKKTGLPAIMYGDIYVKYNTFFKKADFRIDEETSKNSISINKGDLLFTGSGETAEEIGKCVSYQGDDEIYIGGDIIALTLNGGHSLFLAYQQNSYSQIKQKAKLGQGYSVVHIYEKHIRGLNILLPRIKEPEKIAEILYTWDKAIELKEKLINEKKEFKRGLMQKLLTGEMRFLEFNGDWEEVKISKLLGESCVLSKEPDLQRQISVKLHLNGVFLRELKGNEIDGATTLYVRNAGQFIYGKQNFHNGAFGIIPKQLDNCQTSSDIPTFDFKEEINPMYFFYYWSQKNKYLSLEAFTTGTGSKRLHPKIFLNMHMIIPNINEQNKIVEFINSVDKNIELLKSELSQLKEQKRGLMQLLLTGIVRVEVD